MIEKNKVYSGEVLAYGTEGEGIIKAEGTTAFVPFCLIGESVKFKALKVNKDGSVAYGKLEEILMSSPQRVQPPCPVFTKCGGCNLQHMSYTGQLEFKRGLVENALKKIGGISAAVEKTVPCDRQFRYRNKLAIPVSVDEKGDTVLGFYSVRSHRVVPIDDCLIQSEWVKKIIAAVKNFAHICGVKGYDEVTRTGVLRHIVVREVGGKFIIALVAARKIETDFLVGTLKKELADFTLLLNINPLESNVIFSDNWQIRYGDGFFEAEDCGIKYRAGAETFLQVNDGMREKLYSRVVEEAASENTVAIDLYSGGGMLTAMLAKACGKAYGVEIVKEASRCADELCDENGLKGKMINICGRVEDKLDGVFEASKGRKRVVVCDPPRKGMERSVVEKLKTCGADKIILISCNPATLARDLGILTDSLACGADGSLTVRGNSDPARANSPYEITSVTPFDMFPQTKHVETVVQLSKGEIQSKKIRVDFSLEDMDMSGFQKGATYGEIKAYVKEHTGLTVSSLYIAQVKQKCGIIERENYNKPKSENAKQPQCPPEKEAAIREALEYFKMI